jgi:TonB family protein
MIKFFISTALGMGVVAQAAANTPAAPNSYAPDTKWVVDFDDQRCFASRRFRSTSEPLVFGFSPFPMFDWAKVVVERPGNVDGILPLKGKVSIDGGKPYDVVMMAADSANEGKIIYSFTLSGDAFAELRAGQRVHFQSRQLDADIPLTNLMPVVSKLNECIPLLLEHWGHSKERQAMQASYPVRKGLPFRVDDYPGTAVRRGAVGAVEALLNIGIDGRVSDCKLIRSSGHEDLDKKTCDMLIKRGRFEPARDRSGHPMASPYFQSINWLMP